MSFPAGGDGGPLPRAVVGGSYGGGGCGGRTGTGSPRARGASDATATAGATASGCFLGAVIGNWNRKRKCCKFGINSNGNAAIDFLEIFECYQERYQLQACEI